MINKAQQINNYLESKKKGTTRKNNENYKKEWTMKNIRKTDDNQRKHKKPIQRQMKSKEKHMKTTHRSIMKNHW